MANKLVTVTTVTQLVNLMAAAKAGGHIVTLYGVTDFHFNKYPTGTAPKERCPELVFNFQKDENGTARVRKAWHIQYNFAADYDKKFEDVFGVEHKSHDDNREHLVKNVIMRFISTQNVCFIAMPFMRSNDGLLIDGVPATNEQIAYCKKYEQPRKPSAIPYLNPGVRNVYKLVIDHTEYRVNITDLTYTPAAAVAAVAAAY